MYSCDKCDENRSYANGAEEFCDGLTIGRSGFWLGAYHCQVCYVPSTIIFTKKPPGNDRGLGPRGEPQLLTCWAAGSCAGRA